jgi:hypothetical protein
MQAKKVYEECSFFGMPLDVLRVYIRYHVTFQCNRNKLLEYFEIDGKEINWLILFEHFCG